MWERGLEKRTDDNSFKEANFVSEKLDQAKDAQSNLGELGQLRAPSCLSVKEDPFKAS